MSKKILGSRKGLLLTLATVVLLILMLAQIMTYVSTQINYGTLSSGVATTSAVTNFLTGIRGSLPSFLHSSLSNAMSALVAYESTPTLRYDNFTNNTAYALASLMNNGTIYRTSMGSYMGNYVLKNFLNATIAQALAQNVNVIITNASISVYQSSPFMVNATFTGLAVINSSQGTVTYPISATGSVSLNGTQDLFYAEAADPHIIRAKQSYPIAVLIGNSIATQGSSSPFMLASGAAITEGGVPNCGNIPAPYQNANYILVTQNARSIPQNVCGMAGLVTSSANTATPLVPYLVYPATTAGPTANVFGLIPNGTQMVLDGPAMALVNASAIQSAMQNGYYYPSSLAPSYLGYGQGSLSQRSSSGMFSLNLYSRITKMFSGVNSYVAVANSLSLNPTSFTVSAWIYPTSYTNTNGAREAVVSSREAQTGGFVLSINNNGNMEGDFWVNIGGTWHGPITAPNNFKALNRWYLISATYNNSYMSIYVNGVLVNKTAQTGSVNEPAGPTYIGSRDDGANHFFPGKIANVQVYNQSLANQQVAQLYLDGIESPPLGNANLLAWWPLIGNFSDFSGHFYTGVPANVVSSALVNYPGDPASGGSFYNNATNKILGAGNPGCTSLTNCGSNTVSAQLFLSSSPINGNYSGRAAQFNGGSSYFVGNPSNNLLPGVFTLSAWIRLGSYNHNAGACCGSNNAGREEAVTAGTIGGGEGTYIMDAVDEGAIGQIDGFACLTGTGSWTQVASSTGVLQTNRWSLETLTYDGANLRLWLNGVLEGTSAASGTICGSSSSNAIYLGTRANDGSYFNGSMANVQMYNAPLTQAQIAQMYMQGINSAPVLSANLVGWWPLNGNSTDYGPFKDNLIGSYAPYSTQYTNQSSGASSGAAVFHLSDAALPNVAWFGPGGNGYGYIATAASPAFNPSRFSVSFWMYDKAPGVVGNSAFILANTNPANSGWNWGFELTSQSSGSGALYFHSCNTNCNGASVGFSGLNQWYFITGVFDGSNWYLYRNGTLVGSCTSTCSTIGGSTSSMMFGTDACNGCAGSGDNNGYFNGYLSDAKFYSGTALTAAQVQQLYQNDSVAGVGPTDWWPLSGAGFSSSALANQIVDSANSLNNGYMYSNTLICTLSNSVMGQCGVGFAQP
ncbi:MAG: LamG domain-containing protein [Candidatus Micrarchaeota archaeon]|nr:LamG domain-containing protein [Candidatus Micrarchaeota archaeon]